MAPLPDPEPLRPLLESLTASFDVSLHVARDPVQFPHRYDDAADVEVAGFIAACLAFGRVAAFAAALEQVFALLGPRPAQGVDELLGGGCAPRPGPRGGSLPPSFEDLAHRLPQYRWLRPAEVAALLLAVAGARREHGTLEACFAARAGDTWQRLGGFLGELRGRAQVHHPDPGGRARALAFLFPRPSTAACKRQHMFLRWMVRRDGPDFGIWSALTPAELVMPADVHTARIGHALGLCRRAEANRRTADELTASLARLDSDDPVRFDFALCHLGISGGCRARRVDAVCGTCDLRSACRWWRETAEPS